MTPLVILGIDPGLDGGIALLYGVRAEVMPTPTLARSAGSSRRDYDTAAMRSLLLRRMIVDGRPDLAVIEDVHAMPGQGVSSMFKMGFGVGLWHGLLVALEIPFQCVTPQRWKGLVLAGTKKDKAAAITFCQRRYPGVSLLATPKYKSPHDGMADALCLAEFGRRISMGGDGDE